MTRELLVAGGGIAGLAAALGARRAGWEARLFEQAPAFSEVGAGLQLGPNTTRILAGWGVLDDPLLRAFAPPRLRVRDATDGRELGHLALGAAMEARYGAPYLALHRADLHAALLRAVTDAGVRLHAGLRVDEAQVDGEAVLARTSAGTRVEADALAVADGVWSGLRQQLLGDGPAPPTGHVALRALLSMDDLPVALRSDDVQAWLGPRMHLVCYPVRAGQALNVVAIAEGAAAASEWDQAAPQDALQAVARDLCGELRALLEAVPAWRMWPVHDRAPVRGPHEMAHGRAALLGDAAHPMRPYLAQGAGMALEDAFELHRVLSACAGRLVNVPTALKRYALNRWERCARVQRRSRRNGTIFHATGLLRAGRDMAMRTGGESLLDVPWLYRGI
ncbi:MAG: FAD-dependent oxidoreductase [Ramlibacter sp.]